MGYTTVEIDLSEIDNDDILDQATYIIDRRNLASRSEQRALADLIKALKKRDDLEYEGTTPFEDELAKVTIALKNPTWSELDELKILLKDQFKIIL